MGVRPFDVIRGSGEEARPRRPRSTEERMRDLEHLAIRQGRRITVLEREQTHDRRQIAELTMRLRLVGASFSAVPMLSADIDRSDR